MARPPEITDQDYFDWIESQISSGRSIKDITATQLQKQVGGAFPRCAAILAAAKERYASEQASEPASMPAWYRDFVQDTADQAKRSAESLWGRISNGITEQINDATVSFEDKKAEMQKDLDERLDVIQSLEAKVEGLENQAESLSSELGVANLSVSDKREEIASLKSEVASWKQQKADLAEQLSQEKSDRKSAEEELVKVRQERDKLLGKLEALEARK